MPDNVVTDAKSTPSLAEFTLKALTSGMGVTRANERILEVLDQKKVNPAEVHAACVLFRTNAEEFGSRREDFVNAERKVDPASFSPAIKAELERAKNLLANTQELAELSTAICDKEDKLSSKKLEVARPVVAGPAM